MPALSYLFDSHKLCLLTIAPALKDISKLYLETHFHMFIANHTFPCSFVLT